MLGEPEAVVAPALGVTREIERVLERVGRRAALDDRREIENRDGQHPLTVASPVEAATTAGYDPGVSNHRLVYSTDDGDQRRKGSEPKVRASTGSPLPKDGIARVFREKAGRGGKTVTVVRGLDADLNAVAGDLKRHCGTGGTAKEGAIELQGDHREKVVARLRSAGYAAKAAGG